MLRPVILGLVLSVLAVACALVEPPAPPGTFVVQGVVRNLRAEPVKLEVRTPTGPSAACIAGDPYGKAIRTARRGNRESTTTASRSRSG